MTKIIWEPPRLRNEEEEGENKATWLELFFDLVFVVAIAELAHNLSAHLSLSGFMEFAILFIPVWWCWIGSTFYASRFDTDDLSDRLLTLLQMAIVAIMAANVHNGLSSSSVAFALCYIAFRLLLVFQYLNAGYHVRSARELTTWYAVGFGSSIICWLISVFVPIPWRFLFWALGMAIDFATPFAAGKLISKIPPRLSHITERLGLFTIIVLGESVVAVVRGVSQQQQWSVVSIATAILGLVIAFSFWWLYFDSADGCSALWAMKTGKPYIGISWLYAHLPLQIGLGRG